MMGHRQVEQAALFYEFSLEKHVPPDHLLRSIVSRDNLGENGGGDQSAKRRPVAKLSSW